jgi:hypothetical protein
MNQGVYKIFGIQEDEKGNEVRSYYGRLAVIGGHTQVLEDHHGGLVPQMFPDGLIDAEKTERFAQLQGSPYYAVVPEGIVDHGDPQQLQIPEPKPDEVFSVIDQHGQKQKLECFGEDIFLNGKHMTPRELETFQTQVRNKELHLVPEHV